MTEVLRVTVLLLDSRVSKNLGQYASLEHLYTMLASTNLEIVVGALRVLLALGRHRRKMSDFGLDERQFNARLTSLAQSWYVFTKLTRLLHRISS